MPDLPIDALPFAKGVKKAMQRYVLTYTYNKHGKKPERIVLSLTDYHLIEPFARLEAKRQRLREFRMTYLGIPVEKAN